MSPAWAALVPAGIGRQEATVLSSVAAVMSYQPSAVPVESPVVAAVAVGSPTGSTSHCCGSQAGLQGRMSLSS